LECEKKLFPKWAAKWFFGKNLDKIEIKSKPKEQLKKKSSVMLKDNLNPDYIISLVLEKQEKKGNL